MFIEVRIQIDNLAEVKRECHFMAMVYEVSTMMCLC